MISQNRHIQLVPLVLGLSAMYVPSIWGLLHGIWSSDSQAHGPIILGIAIWQIYRNWGKMMTLSQDRPNPIAGSLVFLIGLALYILGRSQDILIFEIGSIIPILTGLILVLYGHRSAKAQWFGLFFLLFMIPLPGPIVDALTMPMKMAVSYVTESILYTTGYPIARQGVTLQIGQYKLLVADACAGLHTLFSLEALGLLYLNIIRHDSWVRNITLAVFIVPISFTANVTRVITLTLITYYFGDAAGQGFLHGFAGIVLFTTALLLIIGVDKTIQSIVNARAPHCNKGGALQS